MMTRVLRLMTCFLLFSPILTAEAGEISQEIPLSEVIIIEDAQGFARFSGKNIQYLAQTGEPAIPYQIVRLLLPPEADPASISVWIEDERIAQVSGRWDVAPIPPLATWDGAQMIIAWPEDKEIIGGRDVDIYESDTLFPESLLGNVSTGQMRTWQLVDIPVATHLYNPATKQLYRLVEGNLIVAYDSLAMSAMGARRGGFADPISEDTVKRRVVNFDAMAPVYRGPVTQSFQVAQVNTYAIITTRTIAQNSSQLAGFVASKEARGFNVEVVTEDIWGGGSGDAAAENIRSWLVDNYMPLNIEYVLLIGNPHTDSGDVPMKMLWPRSIDTTNRESPSDFYYADLTGNWDLDGDGLYGEIDGDFGPGGVDRNWEVLVGRIPFYGNVSDLDSILAKIVAYENTNPNAATWRENVLLPMKPSDADTPGYHLGEAIKDDFLVPKGWDYHRVYDEDYGLDPPAETTPTTVDHVTDAWNASQFGAIFWFTHGWSRGASGIMDLPHAATLDDRYPGFTFQASCTNALPEDDQNLAYSLLINGAIATVGATRVSWYWIGETDYAGSTSNPGMTYEYTRRLVNNSMDSGHALYEMKQDLTPGIWPNFTVYNLYGDPAIGLSTVGLDNDDFAAALSLVGGLGNTIGSNVGATVEPGEPIHAQVPGGASVWWHWTAPFNGQAQFDTFGSDFDTVLAVYTGEAVDALTEVASNDDASDLQSLVTFPITAGTNYKIAVDGYDADTGQIRLNWSSNDEDAVKLPVAALSASGYQEGNPPQNTLDGDLGTRWSAYGDGQWIEYDLGAIAKVSYIKIAWFRGNIRKAAFDVLVSSDGSNWHQVYSGESSGTTVELEAYDFINELARYVRIVGHGNTLNDWNSITEVEVYGKKDADKLPVSAVSASGYQEGNPPENTLDGDLGTRWSAYGDGEWIVYDLGAAAQVNYFMIAWYRGDIRIATFDVEVSDDGLDWRQVYSGESSGTTVNLEAYDFSDTTARYVKIHGYGNSQNGWNSITEVEIYGKQGTVQLPVSSVSASAYQEENPPQSTLDGDLGTRWSAYGDGEWIEYDLGAAATVDYVQIAWYKGDIRSASFDLQVSGDGTAWQEVFSGESSGTTLDLEAYDFDDMMARFVRIIGYGNTSNGWNSITEVEIYGR